LLLTKHQNKFFIFYFRGPNLRGPGAGAPLPLRDD